jgi:hypothetical protein
LKINDSLLFVNLNIGNQPEGKMSWKILNESLSGFETFKTIEISYLFSSGTQKSNHPNPGIYFITKSNLK